MKHKVRISVSVSPQTGSIVTCRNISIRERILRFLIGDQVLVHHDGRMVFKFKNGTEVTR